MDEMLIEQTSKSLLLESVPDPLWCVIFQLLDLRDVSNASQVCKWWQKLVWSSVQQLTVPLKSTPLFTDNNLKFLSIFSTNLLHLDLSRAESITSNGIVELVSSCRKLKTLSLSFCKNIDNEALKAIGISLGDLRNLDISWCHNLTDAGLVAFSQSASEFNKPLLKSLETLEISWCSEITGESGMSLAPFGNLKKLLLHGCDRWTKEQVEQVVQLLPKLTSIGLNWCTSIPHNSLDYLKTLRQPNLKIEQLSISDQALSLDIPSLARKLTSSKFSEVIESATAFRRILSIERTPPIDECIGAGIVPQLVRLLENPEPRIQLESAWALTNIASGNSEHTQVVVSSGAVPIFIRLMESPEVNVREQAIWTIGNIAGDSWSHRDHVIEQGALGPLLQSLGSTKLTLLKNATWCLSNLTRGKPRPPFQKLVPAFPYLRNLLSYPDEEVMTDACWAASFLTDNATDNEIDIFLELLFDPIAAILHNSYSPLTLITPALRVIGNIASGNDSQTQRIIDAKLVPVLASLLGSPKKGIRKEATWTISNLTAGHSGHIQAVIDAGIIPTVVTLLAGAEYDIRKEALWVIANATSGGTKEQIDLLLQLGCFEPVIDMATATESRVVMVALEALENITSYNCLDESQVAKLLEILDDLLQTRVDITEIYDKASVIKSKLTEITNIN